MGCLQMFVRDHTAYNGFGGHDPNGKVASCISAPLDLEGAKANVSLNVGGVGANSRVSVEVLDVDFKVPRLQPYRLHPCRRAGSEATRRLGRLDNDRPGRRPRWHGATATDPNQSQL